MYNSNTKVVVCNSVNTEAVSPATAACKLISLLPVVMSQKMVDAHEALCCNRSGKALEFNGLKLRKRLINYL